MTELADPFTPEQRVRAKALEAARVLLARNNGFAKTDLGENATGDLADLAEYILTGTHPTDRFSPPPVYQPGTLVEFGPAAGQLRRRIEDEADQDVATGVEGDA